MTITTGELDQLIGWLKRRDDEGQEYSAIKTKGALDLARELLAARKAVEVVRSYRKHVRDGFPMDAIHADADAALTAYDQACKSEGE